MKNITQRKNSTFGSKIVNYNTLFSEKKKMKKIIVWAITFALLFCSVNKAEAATYTVLNTNDSGPGSLRQSIVDANTNAGADIIIFNAGVIGTITLVTALPDITGALTITGPGANVLSVSGNNNSRVFLITGGVTVNINNLTITGGNVASNGGGIYVDGSILNLNNSVVSNNTANAGAGLCILPNILIGSATITNSTISGNTATTVGGGIFTGSDGFSCVTLTITNSTISGNTSASGGGIATYCPGLGSTTITNSTISNNVASSSGGGIFNQANVTLINSIVANSTGGDIINLGGTTDAQYSLVEDGLGINGTSSNNLTGDPLLGLLANNGGPTQTIALLPGSVAINAGSCVTATDQRGITRTPPCDIGAYEFVCPAGSLLYVKANAVGANNGTSWTDAFTKLQDALALANSCASITQVWVAAGTYYPDEGIGQTINDRNSTYQLKNDLAIYGGFAGTETLLSQRNWTTNVTILNGDIDQNDGTNFSNNGGNAYNVTTGSGTTNSAILDGFTITGGNANFNIGGSKQANGAGMYNFSGSPVVSNCFFTGNSAFNSGGGMSNLSSSPTITNCSFSGNSSPNSGGGMRNDNSSSSITNCSFSGNSASNNGGGMTIQGFPTPSITNCSFSGNLSLQEGGGMFNLVSSPSITNCSFTGNSAASGGGMFNQSNFVLSFAPLITNCIIWNNRDNSGTGTANASIYNDLSTPVITYCLVQGQNPAGAGNLDGIANVANVNYPLFVTTVDPATSPTTAGNLRLQCLSPAIDAGLDAANLTTTDLDGNPRKFDAIAGGSLIDMGAYEKQVSCCPPSNIVYVKATASGANNGTSWTDAFTKLQDALALTNTCSSITQIWVTKGTYYPDEGIGFVDNDITAAFTMKNNLGIYGGFSGDGTETMLSQRDWTANPTILSGDINKNNTLDNAQDSRHVIFNNFTSGAPLSSSAVLDGFTISGGFASGYNGAGMYNKYASPTISHCNFSNNTAISNYSLGGGGGMYNEDSSPTISYCTFSNNTVLNSYGGGINNNNSRPTISYCTFSNNLSSGSGYGGGGMANFFSSSPTVSYCTFSNNRLAGSSDGGGMLNNNSSPVVSNCIFSGNQYTGMYNRGTCTASIVNCTFSGNTAFNLYGGGMTNNGASCQPTVKNCIFWGNGTLEIVNFNGAVPVVTYSDVKGGYTGTGNINADPLFVSATDLHLQCGSPAINAGTNTGAPATDLEGNPRVLTVADPADMGAYEKQGICCPTITSLVTNTPSTICEGINVTLTVSELTGMETTYGITFKYFNAATADPYTDGTLIATVANGSLTGGGTGATTSTSSLPAGNIFIYAILSPTPTDINCRPSQVVNLTVNPTPATPTITGTPSFCTGSSTTLSTATVAGAIYCWQNTATAPAWINVGAAGFSAGAAYSQSLAFNGGIPYVAFQDQGNSSKASVMRFNGTSWVNVGIAGFSAGAVGNSSLAFNGSTPYVSFMDFANGSKTTVMRFDGANWVIVGSAGFSAGIAQYQSLAFNGSTPYVAFQDQANGAKATVMRFDGSNWVNVGTAGFSAGVTETTSLAFNGSTPYVAFRDFANGGKTTVMRFNGSSWENVGAAGFSAGAAFFQSLAFNGSTPYVAFRDDGNKTTLMRFDGVNWVNVGTAGFSPGAGDFPSLEFNGSTPYVAFQDYANAGKTTVMRFDGANWVNVGAVGFSAGNADWQSLAFNGSKPYVAFRDEANGSKTTVMNFDVACESSTNSLLVNTAATYTVKIINSDGCSATSAPVTVSQVNCCPAIPILVTNPSPAVCEGTNVTLTASGLTDMGPTPAYGIRFKYFNAATADPYTGGTLIATVANGSLTSGGTEATINTSLLPSGDNFIYAILSPTPDDINCRPSQVVYLLVNPIPKPSITGSLSFCEGGSATLDAGADYSGYLWSTNETTQTISVNTAGTFTVVVTNGNGCTGSTFVTTNVKIKPIPIISGELSFCDGSSTKLCGNGGASSYSWSTGSTNQCIVVSDANSYAVTVTNGLGCSASTSLTTIKNPNPTPTISGNLSFCSGSSTTLDAGVYAGYVWSTLETTQTISVNTAGIFSVKVTDGNGCTESASVTTTIKSFTIGAISGLSGACAKQSGLVYCVTNPTPGITSYIWTLPTGVSAIGATTGACITLKFSSKFKGGPICAKAVTPCGNTPNSCMNVVLITKTPNTPGTINGPLSLCPNAIATYSIIAVPNATNYLWSVPSNMQILSGQGSISVIVKALSNFNSGYVKVRAMNCKDGSGTKSMNLVKSRVCKESDKLIPESKNESELLSGFSVFPNPTSEILTITFTSISKTKVELNIIDLVGKNILLKDFEVAVGSNTKQIDVSHLAKGMYFISLESEGIEVQLFRIVVE